MRNANVLTLIFCLTLSLTGFAGVPLTTTLNGSEEVPGPGDEDGDGFAALSLWPGFNKICFLLHVDDIGAATMAHIHKGAEGETGPIAVNLLPPEDGTSHGCVREIENDLIEDIINNPSDYYVNVHNEEFPAGALRGQLGL